MRATSDGWVAVGAALFVIAGVAWALYRPRVQQSERYQATVVPLANIMDVGFIVLSPAPPSTAMSEFIDFSDGSHIGHT